MRPWRLISTVVAVAAFSAVITSRTPSGHAVFEQALAKERVEGNLPEAIRLYERVVAEFASDRALASRALLQVGLCYEKLGKTGAREAYERLVREYADQVQIAGEARTRLGALTRDATAPASRVRMTARELPNIGGFMDLQSVSPDGAKAAVTDVTKGQNLAIVDLATGQSRLLTNFDWGWNSSYASSAVWSPDGRHIAYVQAGQGGLGAAASELRVTTLDGKARTIYRNDAATGSTPVPEQWLPDGSAIMATIRRRDGKTAIGLAAVADGRFTPLRTLGWDVTWRDKPRVSPDGRFVAFVERTSGLGDLHVLSIDGRQAFRITDHPADDRQPIWSPDGRQLAFISNRFGPDALWTVAMEDGQAKGAAVKLKDGMNGVRLVDWPRGGLIYQQVEQTWDVFTIPMGPGTTRSTGSARPLPYARSGWNLSPAWSPDGKSLAFVSGSQSNPNSRYLVVMPSSGGAAREFPMPPPPYQVLYGPWDLRWFGNGRGLGFSGSDAKGQHVVFRLSLSSGEWTTIPVPMKFFWTRIEWNDDGTAFYFARHSASEPNGGIFRMSVEGGREELVYALTTPARVFALEISPDRRWLAFEQQGTQGAGTQVIVVHTASGERRTVTTAASSPDGEILRLSDWSPDGRVLVQRRPSGSGSAEWQLVRLDGGATETLSVDVPASTGSDPSIPLAKWSPDGSSIVFVQRGTSSRAFILENPLADLPAAKTSATRR